MTCSRRTVGNVCKGCALILTLCFFLVELNTKFDGTGKFQENYPEIRALLQGAPTQSSIDERATEEKATEKSVHYFNGEDRAVQSRKRCRDVYGERSRNSNRSETWPVANQQFPFQNRVFLAHGYSLLYCSIAKAASSNWKRIFFELSKEDSSARKLEMFGPIWFRENQYPHWLPFYKNKSVLKDLNATEVKTVMQTYYRFVMVRDPVSKAIAAYKDKFYSKNIHNDAFHEFFQKVTVAAICKDIRTLRSLPGVTPYLKSAYIDCDKKFVDLKAFLSWVFLVPDEIKSAPPSAVYNPHWAMSVPICRICDPTIRYSFIGHFENGHMDSDHVFQEASFHFDFPDISDSTLNDEQRAAFRVNVSGLSEDFMRELYKSSWTERYILGYTDQMPGQGKQYIYPE